MTMTNPTVLTGLGPVTFDMYRDVHKGIRAELFARLPPAPVHSTRATGSGAWNSLATWETSWACLSHHVRMKTR